MLTRFVQQTYKSCTNNTTSTHLRSFASTTSTAATTVRADRHKLFRDVTTFNNGTNEPTPGSFSCSTVHEPSENVAHLIVDCRDNDLLVEHNSSHPQGQQENIVSLLTRMLDIPYARARFLVDIGAVYLGAFPTYSTVTEDNLALMPPMQRAIAVVSKKYYDTYISTSHFEDKDVLEVVNADNRVEGRKYSPVTKRNYVPLNRFSRVVDASIIVKTGNYMRVALHPKRSRVALSMSKADWRARVLYEDESILVIDKPAGIVSVPTNDNLYDNVAVNVGKMIGFQFQQQHFQHINVKTTERLECEMLPFLANLRNNNKKNKKNNEILPANINFPEERSLSDEQIWHAQMYNLKIQASPPPWQTRPAGSEARVVKQIKGRNYMTRRLTTIIELRPQMLVSPMQRLDTGTSGCMLFSKSKAASNKWMKLIKNRQQIKTFYTAICFSFEDFSGGSQPVPLGSHTHYLDLQASCPVNPKQHRTLAHNDPDKDRKRAEMVVTDIRAFEFEGSTSPASIADFDADTVQLWEIDMELKTGKTHQIRAQLETFGVCIVGDTLYPISIGATNSKHSLDTQAITKMDGRLGLQACRLELDGLNDGDIESNISNKSAGANFSTDSKESIESSASNASGSENDSEPSVGEPVDTKSLVAGTPWWKEKESCDEVMGIISDQFKALKSHGVLK